jgi:hypothetical protein
MSVVGSVAFGVRAWSMMREGSVLALRESALRASLEKDKAQIQIETDVEKLRDAASRHADSKFAEWEDYCYRLRHMSGALLWSSFGLAAACATLGYSIYGLRNYKPVA